MRKTTLFSTICLFTAMAAWAGQEGSEARMRVTMPSGHAYTLALEPGLCIHLVKAGRTETGEWIENDHIVVVNVQQDTLYTVNDVAMLSYLGNFPDPPTGIDQTEGEAGLRLQEDGISLSGCPAKAIVSVYSVDGKQYFRAVAQDGTCFVPRQGLPQGVLIIKVNNKAIKLINR